MTSAMEIDAILDKLRASLKRRGAEGIRGLSRHFKIVDRDRSGSIDSDEFAQLCTLNRLGLNDSEQRVLMRAFDGDGNGRVDYEEFLRGVRGRLNPTRKKMVRQIFDALDKIGGDLGYLTIAAVQPVYSVSQHPQVKAGKMTKEEALQEFLNAFEGSQGNRDGRITLDEWIKYYEEVSVSVDSDDYFGTMLSGTWAHLKRKSATPGGKAEPVVKFTAKAEIDRLEGLLRKYIYAKVPNDQNTKRQVQKAFADFDTDGSGAVSLTEFIKALERFGMHVAGQRPGIGGLGLDVVQSLFDKYDKDGSGAIDYKEFTAALFRGDEQAPLPPAPSGKQKGKAGIKQALCADTAYLKLSNHIFGPISRGEEHNPGQPGGLAGIGGGGAVLR